jgi:chorismate mutase
MPDDDSRQQSAPAFDRGPSALDKPRSSTGSDGGPGSPVLPRVAVRALRGATTVDEDTPEQVTQRTQELLRAMLERNGVAHEDLISVLFTATDDIHSMFPATAARGIGFGDVPLLCARELDIPGAQPRCIRVMMHIETSRAQLHHVYLEGARGLRDDLPD